MSHVEKEVDDLRLFEAIRKGAGVGNGKTAYRNVDLAEDSNTLDLASMRATSWGADTITVPASNGLVELLEAFNAVGMVRP